MILLKKSSAESLNQGDATGTASSEPILKAVHLIAIFRWQMALVTRITKENIW